jgi:hypothetical protein
MSWDEKKSGGRYFYLSQRRDGRTRKLYFGSGLPSRMAADRIALHRAELKAQADSWRAAAARWEEIEVYRDQLQAGTQLLTSATLLAAGFTRQCRHGWKRRQHARHR